MYRNRNKKVMVVLLILLLALLLTVVVVSAAENAGFETAIAALDLRGEEGLPLLPVEGIDFRPISPWHIDATSILT
jgi:hypothetical protein